MGFCVFSGILPLSPAFYSLYAYKHARQGISISQNHCVCVLDTDTVMLLRMFYAFFLLFSFFLLLLIPLSH